MSCSTCGSDRFDALSLTSKTISRSILMDLEERGGFREVIENLHPDTSRLLVNELAEIAMTNIVRLVLDLETKK